MSILSDKRSLRLTYEKIPLSLSSFYIGNPNICKHKKKYKKKLKNGPCQHKTWQKNNKKNKKIKNKKIKIKIKYVGGGGGGGGGIFSICSVWSLTHCHSWNNLPCSHQQFSIIVTFYRPPATTISFYSTTSPPEKKKPSSNRLGTPLSRGLRSQKGLRPFNPLQNR